MAYVAFNSSETQVAVANHDFVDYCAVAAIMSIANADVAEIVMDGLIQSLESRDDEFLVDVYSKLTSGFAYTKRSVSAFNLSKSAPEHELDILGSPVMGDAVWSPDKTVVAIGHNAYGTQKIEVVAGFNGEHLFFIKTPPESQPRLVFSPDSRFLVWSDFSVLNHNESNFVYVHDSKSGDLIHKFEVPGRLHLLEYSPCGRMIAVWQYPDPPTMIFDTQSYKMIGEIDRYGQVSTFSPNSHRFACAGTSVTIAEVNIEK